MPHQTAWFCVSPDGIPQFASGGEDIETSTSAMENVMFNYWHETEWHEMEKDGWTCREFELVPKEGE